MIVNFYSSSGLCLKPSVDDGNLPFALMSLHWYSVFLIFLVCLNDELICETDNFFTFGENSGIT